MLTIEKMYNAVKNNDSSYDGIFFYAVKTTKIYCKPSCKSKLPKFENILYFNTILEAQNAGFRACKRCRSDLLKYEPKKDIVEEIKANIDELFAKSHDAKVELNKIALSQKRVNELFKEEYGFTLKAYIDTLRIKKAKHLLVSSKLTTIEIAYAIGFNSSSAFYSFFKNHTEKTPGNYKKEHKV